MRIDEFRFETIVTADRGKYLKFENAELAPEKVGRPVRIIFSKTGIIPNFTEAFINDIDAPTEEKVLANTEEVPQVTEEEVAEVPKKKSVKKTTKKKSTK